MKFNFLFEFIFIIFTSFIKSVSEDEILKHSKALACMFLLRKVMGDDNLDRQAFTLNLIKCYTTIDIAQINSIMNVIQTGDEIDGSDYQYKELLNGEEIKKTKTIQEIQLISTEINTVMKQLQQRQMKNIDNNEFNEEKSQYGLFSQMLIGLLKILAIDGYLRYGIMIVFGFLLLKSISTLLRNDQKKKNVKKMENEKENKDKTE